MIKHILISILIKEMDVLQSAYHTIIILMMVIIYVSIFQVFFQTTQLYRTHVLLSGTVRMKIDDDSYLIRDSTGYSESILRDDIFADADDDDTDKFHYVIALHPQYEYSYCPGKVTGRSNRHQDEADVEFYDGTKATLSRDDMYAISREKYHADSDYIRFKEEELVGQVVVARKDDSGIFQIG